jgi:excinuclease ABC subunit A
MNEIQASLNPTPKAQRPIRLTGVRQNNLKNFSVEIPKRQLTVITGLSGSGKSSLAFDTLYAEGQRRYVESLSTYTRQFLEKMPKPELDSVENIPPAIALEQKNNIVNSRSTVGTQTEVLDFLRVLFARTGQTECVSCGGKVLKLDPDQMTEIGIANFHSKRFLVLAPLSPPPEIDTPLSEDERKKKKKSGPKKSKKTEVDDLKLQLDSLQKNGLSRIAVQRGPNEIEVLTIEESIEQAKSLRLEMLMPVMDRLKLPPLAEVTDDDRSRLTGSIDQALAIGQNRVIFYSPDVEGLMELNRAYACANCRRIHRQPEPLLFSFNSPIGACEACSGFGHNLELDERLVVPNPSLPLKNGAIDPFTKPSFVEWQSELFKFATRNGIPLSKRYSELTPSQKKLIWKGDGNDDSYPGIEGAFASLNAYKYKLHVRVFIRRYQDQKLCSVCKGARLHSDALAVKLGKKNIAEILDLPIHDAIRWLSELKFPPKLKKLVDEPYSQIERRLNLLDEVGVNYLTLSRLAKTLSGGEFQRINLATQLGNGLCGTLYILDEPSIGLHPSDTERLIGVLKKLRDQGNTVVVVEHDLDMMRAADHIIELGPFAGKKGGYLVASGPSKEIQKNPESVTGQFLTGKRKLERVRPPRGEGKRWIRLTGCREHNLKNLDVRFPLDRLTVVTGLSGSGKSTLVHQTLFQSLSKLFYQTNDEVGRFDHLYGADQIRGVVLLDQTPIGKSSRSNPATYLKAWDEIRRIYANQVLSLRRGLTPQHFSFNVDGGRCPVCKGEGEITLDMHFMAEMKLPCDECGGKRFKKNVLEISVKGKSVYELLTTTIDEAYELFRENSILARKLGILRDVGLGYLQVGQSATTLSGGESQRLKIAATLEERSNENLLYLFDEPTTGLHLDDIQRLIRVIQDLVDAGHSCLLIEHHLDLIAQADWVIDLGPGGGVNGGDLMGEGTPEALTHQKGSVTGELLRPYFPNSVPERRDPSQSL